MAKRRHRRLRKIKELRGIRRRLVLLFYSMIVASILIIFQLAFRIFISREPIAHVDFYRFCLTGIAALAITVAQLAILRSANFAADRRFEAMTYVDELTGLGNRRSIAKLISEEVREAQISQNPLTILYVDLDGFKQINDRHGHAAGDMFLRAVSHALRRAVRETDFVGRAGGDEFIVVLPNTDSQRAMTLARRIIENIVGVSINTNETTIGGITASIGISSYPANAHTRERLVEDADRAMYVAKQSGGNKVVISVSRGIGPEPRASTSNITSFEAGIGDLVDRGRGAPPQQIPEKRDA